MDPVGRCDRGHMKNCQITTRPLASCKRGRERKPAFLLAYPVTWRLFSYCRNCSPQLEVQEGISNIQTAVLAVAYKWLYNWSSFGELAGTWSTAAWTGLTFWKRFTEDDYNKELPTTGAWSTVRGVRHIRRLGRLNQHRGTFARRRRIAVESRTNWLSADCLSASLVFLSVVRAPLSSPERLNPVFSSTSTVLLSLQMILPLLLPQLRLHPLPLSSTPADLSRIPQMCLFMCSAKWSDREKHLQPKERGRETENSLLPKREEEKFVLSMELNVAVS